MFAIPSHENPKSIIRTSTSRAQATLCLSSPLHPNNLLLGPILAHIIRAKHADLVVQMRPEHLSEPVHDLLELGQPQFPFPAATPVQIRLELLQPFVDLFVLGDEVVVGGESGHPFRELREHVLFFDRVVHRQGVAEVQALRDEGAQRHPVRAGSGRAGLVQQVPGVAEMVVLEKGMLARGVHQRAEGSVPCKMTAEGSTRTR